VPAKTGVPAWTSSGRTVAMPLGGELIEHGPHQSTLTHELPLVRTGLALRGRSVGVRPLHAAA